MIKDPDEEYEPDNGPTYSNGETTVLYDVDGEQHVLLEVNDDKLD
jgi:hypothetical protein